MTGWSAWPRTRCTVASTRPLGLNTSHSSSYSAGVRVAQPIVELQVGQDDLDIQRQVHGVAHAEVSLCAYDRLPVRTLSVLDRKQTIFQADVGRQFVDKERQVRAFPHPFAQPGGRLVADTIRRGGRGVIAEPIKLDINDAAVERELSGHRARLHRDTPAQGLRQGQSR